MNQFSSKNIAINFFFLALAQYGGLFVNLAFSIWLTRLLRPQDFGVVAIAFFYMRLFNWITEWGWEQAFMAHKEIELERGASAHFALRFFLALIPLISFLLLYPLLIRFVSSDIYTILLLLSVVNFCNGLGLTYKVILERSYMLRQIALMELLISLASYILAVAAARSGMGVYSLVVQRFVNEGLISVGFFVLSPWKGGFRIDFEIIKTFFRSFGFASWLGGVFGITIYDFMPFLVGVLADTAHAGLYAKAFSLSTFPVMLTGIFSRVTVPIYTNYQYDKLTIKRVFFRTQLIKFIILFPLQLSLCLFAPVWIPLLLGPKWAELVVIYQVMCVYGLFRAFFDDVPNVLIYGFKNIWALTRNQILQSVLILIIGPVLVYRFQSLGGATTMTIVMGLATTLFWRTVCKVLVCSWSDFVNILKSFPGFAKEKIVELLR